MSETQQMKVVTINDEAQARKAMWLRQMADDIEDGKIVILDCYESVHLFDTTQPDDKARRVQPDHSSYLMLLRYERPERKGLRVRQLEPIPAEGKTLGEYLKEANVRGVIDHALRAHVDDEGRVSFYIHPMNTFGDTRDYEVRGNRLRPDPRVTRQD
jgi:hypothetical protein